MHVTHDENMKLHEAIEKLLILTGRPMTTQQIADELNKNGWYEKKDSSRIQAFQIHGRTKNYPSIFEREGSTVSLKGKSVTITKDSNVEKSKPVKQEAKQDISQTKLSFDPISNYETSILILGSMPGDKSLKLEEYYAHSGNRFWKIISTITNSNLPITYSDKKELLLKSKIGIWDVAYKVKRKGSLDTNIKDEEPNDLDNFLANHKSIKVIGFNGKKSEAIFDRFFTRKNEIKYVSLLSTSSANSGFKFDAICEQWQQILI
jgi:hypoxanthine-DNA glycosylase